MRKAFMLGSVLALVGAWSGAGEIPKEQRSRGKLVITADLDFNSVWRQNQVDFSDDTVLTSRAATGTGGKTNTKSLATADDDEAFTRTNLALNFNADLGADAYMAFQVGASDIAGRTFGAALGAVSDSGAGNNSQVDFAVVLLQAYAHLDNFLVDKLSFRLGVQGMTEGLNRGNDTHFLLNTGDLGHRFQIRNGGDVDYAFNATRTGGAAATSADFTDINERSNPGFGWKANYNFEVADAAIGVDALWTTLEETGTDEDDSEVFGLYGSYGFELAGKEKSLITVHAANFRDDGVIAEEDIGSPTRVGDGSNYWGWGLGGQLYWEGLEIFGEWDIQNGDFNDGARGARDEKDIDASAWYLGGKYDFKDIVADMTPWVEGSIWSYSGDDDPNDTDNEAYVNWGSNHETMVLEDNHFGIGLSNNYFAWRLKGGLKIDSGVGPVKGDKSIEVSYNLFELNEDTIVAANSVTGAQITEDSLGEEWDIKLRWGYSENIGFSLGFAWFLPGDAVEKNLQLGGVTTNIGNDDTVTQVRLDSSFRF